MVSTEALDMLLTLIHVIGILAWSMPIFALTLLAFVIEHYTKFKTYWKLLLIASCSSLLNTTFLSYKYWTLGEIHISQMLAVDLLLLSGTLLAGYASLKLLEFQHLHLGKTSITIKLLAALAILGPIFIFIIDGITPSTLLDSIAYNLSIIFLILVFLTLGKITRQYVSNYRNLAYNATRLASILLLLDPIQRNYAAFFGMGVTVKQIVGGMAVLTHFFADILLLPSLILLMLEAKARGIHVIPGFEKSDTTTPLRYRLKKGYTYLVREHKVEDSLKILTDYVTHGYHGLCVTRVSPSDIRDTFGIHTTPILWMTKTETDEKTIQPQALNRLQSIIADFIRNKGNFILLQRLDYLITQNDFEQVLSLIQDISDIVSTSDSILLVALDTSTLSRQQQALLLQELEEVEVDKQTILNQSLYELITFIHGENKRRRSPNIKAVTREFDITKTTARKRIYELESMGLVKMVRDGRSKLLELTEEGKKIIRAPVGPVER